MTDSRNLELFVSLGHNASACVAVDGVLVAGYEQERLDRVKSSSAFPREAIDACLGSVKTEGVDTVYVSHWFDDWTLRTCKYLDYYYLYSLVPRRDEIVTHHPHFTHHDAHARSAQAFARSHGECGATVVVVMDGFGNRQECFSVYRTSVGDHQPVLAHRIHGYRFSLGLMYQYATEFVGLKMHQDEYKLLGYESHILKHFPVDRIETLGRMIDEEARAFVMMSLDNSIDPDHVTANRQAYSLQTLIDLEQLKDAREFWRKTFASWLELFGVGAGIGVQRIVVAFCVQRFLEEATRGLLRETVLKMPGSSNDLLVLTGGSFFNVKLNLAVQRYTGMRTMAHPWAGDAGAAMGMSIAAPVSISEPFLGHREYDPDVAGSALVSRERWAAQAAGFIQAGRIVNVVRGSMEYGPRALCHTTTFALPTRENVAKINALNERDESMPMAPVMTREAAVALLNASDLSGIAVSDRYMITTARFANGRPPERLMGVAHKDPLYDVWTARPQVTDDPEVVRLLRMFPDECLINTSFNYHGEPIVHSWAHAVKTHSMQRFRAKFCGMDKDLPVLMLVTP